MSESKQEKVSVKTADAAKCPYHIGIDMKTSPHIHDYTTKSEFTGHITKTYDTVLDHVGRTPMVEIKKIGKKHGLKCRLLAKCEFFNAGGSVKDRIGVRMIEDAERQGRIKPGETLIEPTSGNTGIGLALAAAVKGYKMVITLPEKMSNEKVSVLKALGAKIYRTPTEAAFDSEESHIGLAIKLNKQIPNSHILDQYSNPGNPMAHYDNTAEEILIQCNNKIDMVVLSAGTGGTISGIAAKIKTKLPKCVIVGVDPYGSILADPNADVHSYHVEGIGYDFIPQVMKRDLVDKWIQTGDKESFIMARALIKEEGLLVGGSSGACLVGALKAAKNLKEGQTCVFLCPDSVRNYITKFLSDQWMQENNFLSSKDCENKDNSKDSQWWHSKNIEDLLNLQHLKSQKIISISENTTVQQAIQKMTKQGIDQVPLLKENKENKDNQLPKADSVIGVVTISALSQKLFNSKIKSDDLAKLVVYKGFKSLEQNTNLNTLSEIFNQHPYVIVTKNNNVTAVLTRVDLLTFITSNMSV